MTSTEYEYHIDGQKFWCRAGSNDEDVVRSVRSEYQLPDSSQYEKGSVALDVGGHIGAWAIFACSQYQDLKVIIVEPLPENLALIKKNISLNQLQDRILVVKGAVGSGETIRIYYTDPSTESGRIHYYIGNSCGVGDKDHEYAEVPIVQLRQLLSLAQSRFSKNKIWCIKTDCEGGEVEFLKQATLNGSVQFSKWIIGEEHGQLTTINSAMEFARFRKHSVQNPAALFCYENPTPFSKLC